MTNCLIVLLSISSCAATVRDGCFVEIGGASGHPDFMRKVRGVVCPGRAALPPAEVRRSRLNPSRPRVDRAWLQRLNLKSDELLSNFGFKADWRRCSEVYTFNLPTVRVAGFLRGRPTARLVGRVQAGPLHSSDCLPIAYQYLCTLRSSDCLLIAYPCTLALCSALPGRIVR
jgi:hypothetical protein